MRSVRGKSLAALAAVALALCAAACSSSGSGSTSSTTAPAGQAPTGSVLKIAFIYSKTGVAAPESQDGPIGFLSRIDLANAQGGVDGHKIVPLVYDDQSSTTGVATAVKLAISQGAIGIVSDTAFMFAAAQFPQQAGIPVTGGSYDGFEWGTQPYTNMFASDQGNGLNPTVPYTLSTGKFFKAQGATVIGSYGYSISPSSTYGANSAAKASLAVGLKNGVLDTTVPFGSVDFATEALAAKTAGVNGIYAALDNNSNFALETALKQAGVNLKAVQFETGYEPDIIGSPAWQEVQGAYFGTQFRPTSIPNAGTIQMVKAMQQYQGRKPADFPTFAIYEGWLGADLMLKGIGLASPNPTSAKIITDLRKVTSYNGEGLLPINVNFTTNFGKGNPIACGWNMKAEEKGFVAASTAPQCYPNIPGSTSKTAPA
jgi:branched-chain amino acid transport system substrate-binding protein